MYCVKELRNKLLWVMLLIILKVLHVFSNYVFKSFWIKSGLWVLEIVLNEVLERSGNYSFRTKRNIFIDFLFEILSLENSL